MLIRGMALRIHKILNNNAVVLLDDGKEKILWERASRFKSEKMTISKNGVCNAAMTIGCGVIFLLE
jgi:hypothetical protein